MSDEIAYECIICGRKVLLRDLEYERIPSRDSRYSGRIRCQNERCRSNILRKVRPPIVKRVKCI